MNGRGPDAQQAGVAERHGADDWWFLGVRIKRFSTPAAPVAVAEAILPAGASPPLHVHAALDDSFYVIEGTMVVRCGDEVSLAVAGAWVPFPSGVPHTFRVIGGTARVLMVHANDSFMRAVQDMGRPAATEEVPTTIDGTGPDDLARAMARHDMRVVGPPMEEDEAQSWLQAFGYDNP